MRAFIAFVFVIICVVFAQDSKPLTGNNVSQQGTIKPGQYNFHSYKAESGFSVEFHLLLSSGNADIFVGHNENERPVEGSGAATSTGRDTGNDRRVVMQIPPGSTGQTYTIGILGRGDEPATYTLNVKTHGFSEPASLSHGTDTLHSIPVLKSFAVPVKAGQDVNITLQATGAHAEFFADPNHKWPSFTNYRFLRHVAADSSQSVIVPGTEDGVLYISVRPASSQGKVSIKTQALSHKVNALSGTPTEQSLKTGDYHFFTFRPDAGSAFEITGNPDVEESLEIFISPSAHERPTVHNHIWRNQGASKSVVVPISEAHANMEFMVGVRATKDTKYSISSQTHKKATSTMLKEGTTARNTLKNTMAAYYQFDAPTADTDLNITITADEKGGVEFFADRNEQFPSFSRYMQYSYVIAGKSSSIVLCVHEVGPFYFAVRPTSPDSTASITVTTHKHSTSQLVAGTPITGTVSADGYKFYTYSTGDGTQVEFALNVNKGDAELFVTDNPSTRPIEGHSTHTTLGTDADKSHRNIVIQLPPDVGTRDYQIGVQGKEDSEFTLTASTQAFNDPSPVTLGQNTTNSDAHTMIKFYQFNSDGGETDYNVTVYTDSTRGAHFFADQSYKYPSFNRYNWFRHIMPHEPTSMVLCAHEAGPVYVAIRSLGHGGTVSMIVQKSPHKIGVMQGAAGFQ